MRQSQLSRALLAALILAFVNGCDHNVYELLLQPQDNALRRTLECRRVDSRPEGEILKPMEQDELDRLTAVYEVPSGPTEARRFTFARTFTGNTPSDVGGAGVYRCWHSSLGALCVYAERFRGSDDQAAVLEKRQQAVDRLSGLLGDWLQARLGQTPGWDKLEAFVRGAFRHDLRNLALMAWSGQFAQDAGLASAAVGVTRMLLFLSEHGYLLPDDVPAWGSAVQGRDAVEGSLGPLAPLIASAVARRAGIAADAEVIVALGRELARSTLEDELNSWLVTTPAWQVKTAEWEAKKQREPGAAAPAPVEILSDLALAAAGFDADFSGTSDELRLRLQVPARPFYTNGTWEVSKREVTWKTTLPAAERTPYLVFASWASPDDAAQKQHFGRVLLRDQALADYVLWFAGLSRDEATEWDAFVTGLRPEVGPAARLAGFRFKREEATGPATEAALASSRAQPARTLLLDALSQPERVQATP